MTDEPDRSRERSSAGAWAAAAVVLAVGALIFGVLAHIRITDLENRVASLEAEAAYGSASVPGGDVIATGGPSTVAPVTVAAEQPVDPEAAKADVIAAFGAVYSAANGLEARLARVDDPTGVAEALSQVGRGPYASAATQATVNVNDVQFTSTTRATVIYGVSVPGQPPVLGRSGEARVAAGAWKVTRSTVCADLEAVGGNCG